MKFFTHSITQNDCAFLGDNTGDDIKSLQSQIFSLRVIRSSLEVRALSLGQFLGESVEYSHKGEFSSVCSSCREFLELYFADLSVLVQIHSHLLFTGIL
jgi:hypothetical protein